MTSSDENVRFLQIDQRQWLEVDTVSFMNSQVHKCDRLYREY